MMEGLQDDGILLSEEKKRHVSRRSVHVRAMSDPFDTQEEKESLHDLVEEALADEEEPMHSGESLPTMPRFPVADTRNKNCWSEPQVDIFQVRGPMYFDDKKKITSGPYLLDARGCDIFLTDEAHQCELEDRYVLYDWAREGTRRCAGTNVCRVVTHRSVHILGGQLRRQPTLLINFRFPWGFMALYFEIKPNIVPYMTDSSKPIDENLSPPEQTLAKWLQGSTAYKNERLKLIPYVAEGPWVVRNMVTGRPAIIGKKLPVSYDLDVGSKRQAPLLSATLDIGNSTATAKRIVSVCRRYMSSLTVDIGFVIQSELAAELPEQMLGSIRIHGPDPLKAPTLRK